MSLDRQTPGAHFTSQEISEIRKNVSRLAIRSLRHGQSARSQSPIGAVFYIHHQHMLIQPFQQVEGAEPSVCRGHCIGHSGEDSSIVLPLHDIKICSNGHSM